MTAVWKFRVLALCSALIIGAISLANLAAEFLRPAPLPFPSGNSIAPTAEQVSSVHLATTVAPFRSDLAADYAFAVAGQALKSTTGQQSEKDGLQNAVRSALRMGPHDSRMWLLLALARTSSNPADPLIAESFKMSYLTGPNDAAIIPIRLGAVTANNILNDADLADLARSDVRAMLTQGQEQRQTLISEYAGASETGKKFIEQSVSALDPAFSDKLRRK
jgi:hypothetical protein